MRAGDVNLGAFADCNVGELLADQGRLEEAEPLLRRALQIWRGTADEHGVAFVTALLGRLYARSGRVAEAIELLEDALERFNALHVEVDAAQRVHGRIALAIVARHMPGANRDVRDRVGAISHRHSDERHESSPDERVEGGPTSGCR
jgi:tetratricopeptide (TPR) repeat protein